MNVLTTPLPANAHATARIYSPLALLTILAAAAIACAIQSLWIPLDSDVSWLITVSEQILGGDRLYVDILEVNPPASVWLYLPLVWMAHLVGIRPEIVVAAAFLAGSAACVVATARLASRFDHAPNRAWLSASLAFITLVLPMALFAQREHAAMLLALPALAAVALVAEGKRLSLPSQLASGIAGGLIIVIKPPFLLAIAAPVLWAAWKRRSLRPFLPAAAAGTVVALVYGLAVLLVTPAYFGLLPVIGRTYVPMHNVLWKVIVGPTAFPTICVALAILLRPRRIPPLAMAWGLGALGFVLAAILQGKNYPNHWLPGTGLAMAAVAVVLAESGVSHVRRAGVGLGLALLAFGAMYQWAIHPDPAIAAAALKVAPPHPSVIGLSPQLATGHPLTRNIGGRWVGSRAGLFTAAGARFSGFRNPQSRDDYREDVNSFARDVAANRPDVVLVDRSSKRWLMREPVIARAMQAYRLADAAADTEIWVRR